jgi:uncharacterized protein (DUF2336 family)
MAEKDGKTDIRLLADLARDVSHEGRGDLYANIADIFERQNHRLSDNERTLMVEILERLSHDVEMSVRRALADRLAEAGNAPYELVRMLANDEVLVAEPVLSRSPLLEDEDLIAIVESRTRQHQLAIAMRNGISEDVSAALVDAGDKDVIITLLNNHDARISESVMEYLAEESRRIDSYQRPLIRRPDLPRRIATRMYEWVSAELKGFIAERFALSETELEEAIKASVADVSPADEHDRGAAERLVEQLRERGKLNAELVLRALQQGQISLFEAALAAMSGMNRTLLQKLIYEDDGKSLAQVAKAIGIKRSEFLLIFQSIRQSRQEGTRLSKDETIALSRLFDDISPEAAQLQVQRWARQAA